MPFELPDGLTARGGHVLETQSRNGDDSPMGLKTCPRRAVGMAPSAAPMPDAPKISNAPVRSQRGKEVKATRGEPIPSRPRCRGDAPAIGTGRTVYSGGCSYGIGQVFLNCVVCPGVDTSRADTPPRRWME